MKKAEWKEKADKKRLEKLRGKSDLHIKIVKALRDEFGYDNVKEFVPLRVGNNVTFRDIWIPYLSFCIKLYDKDESKDWFAKRFPQFGKTFIHKEKDFEGAIEHIQEMIFKQIDFLNR